MRAPCWPRLLVRALLCLAWFALVAEGGNRGRHRRRPKLKEKVPDQFFNVLFWTWAAVFVPAVAYFVYSVARDPLTPELLRAMARRGRESLLKALRLAPVAEQEAVAAARASRRRTPAGRKVEEAREVERKRRRRRDARTTEGEA